MLQVGSAARVLVARAIWFLEMRPTWVCRVQETKVGDGQLRDRESAEGSALYSEALRFVRQAVHPFTHRETGLLSRMRLNNFGEGSADLSG